MRIVCLTHAYPRWDDDMAGAFVERLVLALARRGHRLTVVAPADVGRGGAETRGGVPVERVRYAPARLETLAYRGTMLAAARSPWGFAAFTRLLVRLARAAHRAADAIDADVIHAHWWVPAGLAAWLASGRKTRRHPYVVTLHGTDVAVLRRFLPARPIGARVLARAAQITAVSSYLAQQASEIAGVPSERCRVIPMPVDPSLFAASKEGREARGAAAGGEGGIVTVGRLTRQKRIRLLIDAVGLLVADGLHVTLTVVGDGPERANLERLARDHGLDHLVRFTGAVEPERIAALVTAADVFGFPAVGEGLGLAAAEALMLGVPVVAARDGGGVTDVVPAQGAGRLVPPDAAAFAAALREVLEDPASRVAAARAADALSPRFAPDHVARAFEEVYARAVGDAAGDDAAGRGA